MSDGDEGTREGEGGMFAGEGIAIEVPWVANPMRADRFEELWLPVAESALDYGAMGWALFRDKNGLHEFTQWAFFAEKLGWERYWYSEEVAEARIRAQGLYQVPVQPVYYAISGMGTLAPTRTGG